MGELDVEARGLQCPLGLHLGRVRGLQGLATLVDDLLGDGTGLYQVETAIELALGQFDLGAGIRELAVGLLGHRLERARVDHVEQVALAHDRAVLELDRIDEAPDARPDLYFLYGFEAAGELVPIGDGALDRLGDRDGRRRRSRRLRGRLFASGEPSGRSERQTGAPD